MKLTRAWVKLIIVAVSLIIVPVSLIIVPVSLIIAPVSLIIAPVSLIIIGVSLIIVRVSFILVVMSLILIAVSFILTAASLIPVPSSKDPPPMRPSTRGLRDMSASQALAAAALAFALCACNALLGNSDATPTDAGHPKGETGAAGDSSLVTGSEAGEAGSFDAGLSLDAGLPLVWVDPDDPRAVAVDANNLYWIDAHNLYGCPLAGCGAGPELITGSGGSFASLLDDGQYLYWSDEGRSVIGACSITAGACLPDMTTTLNPPRGLAQDGYDIYWSEPAGLDISQCPLHVRCTGTNMSVTASALVAPSAMTFVGPDLYWTEGVEAGAVRMCNGPFALACTPQTLATTMTVPGGIAGDVKGAAYTLPGENTVFWVAAGSSASTEVARDQRSPTAIALDAKYVYWADLEGLKACPRATGSCGSTPMLLAPLPLAPGGITVLGGRIYGALRAIDPTGNPAPAGAIYSVPAPP